ncbi:MAG TPA: arylesterase [Burkholderiales bacterium]|nr:arylesterase [Burkholderiales bacterium]
MPLAIRTFVSFFMLWSLGAAAAEKSILVFGDSLSAAYGIAQSRGWVALLGERLKRERPDYSVANASISGETSAGGLARIDAALARHRPAVVIVELGANDGLRGLPLGQMKANLGTIIEHAKNSGARVLLLGMKLPPNYGEDYTKAFEGAFADVAKRYQVALPPFMLEGFAEKPEYFQADRIHPNEKAQPLILERVWRALKPLLK